jgi:hypothetical protein
MSLLKHSLRARSAGAQVMPVGSGPISVMLRRQDPGEPPSEIGAACPAYETARPFARQFNAVCKSVTRGTDGDLGTEPLFADHANERGVSCGFRKYLRRSLQILLSLRRSGLCVLQGRVCVKAAGSGEPT